MRKYFLIGFLILIFSFTGFAQNSSKKFKIEDFVLARILPSKTVIFVGDRFELRLEIIYLKDVGIKILTEELEKDSLAAFLPDSIVLEKAEISQPLSWNEYWVKVEAVYTLFYPEKKHNAGILFFPEDSKPLKIRFKWTDEEDKDMRNDVEIYEVNVRPGQFILGVRSMLTDTSNSPRDDKLFSGNFTLKALGSIIIGLVLVLFVLSIPIRLLVRYFQHQRSIEKKTSTKKLLKAEYKKLKAMQILDSDQFCQVLRKVIEIKAGIKASAMTSTELKERALDKDLTGIITILEKHDGSRYNPAFKLDIEESKKGLTETKAILREWTISKIYKFWNRLRKFWQRRKKDG